MVSLAIVLGGARSGKSRFAEKLAQDRILRLGGCMTYVATAQISDEEMACRVKDHQSRRGIEWHTVEEPLHVAHLLRENENWSVVVIDCLSLLLNNWMWIEECNEDQFLHRQNELVATISQYKGQVICVSNEVGQGIVPDNPLARQYRDWLGWFNQAVAKVADEAFWVVAGIPIDLKRFEAML